jgi:predicted O-methyltransferase YrrM
MPLSTCRVATERPARFVKQLTSHLGHNATATLTADGRGVISFANGAACVLMPAGSHLELIATGPDAAALALAQDVISRHLERFAAREELAVDWTPSVDGGDLDIVDPVVSDYLLTHCTPADELLQDLVTRTREATGRSCVMQISHDQGALLTMLARMVDARFAVEVGVFTGYSSICIARALPDNGRLLACDTSHEWTAIAQEYWQRAGVAERIDLRIGPAIDTLRALPARAGIDFAFIDADKDSYPAYYAEIVERLRPGGLLVLDNVLLGGRVVDPAYQDEHHLAMRRLNEDIAVDDRVESVMLPLRDGVTIARKR